MDAPLYPPAMAYTRPHMLSQALSVRDTPIAELKTNPAAWAIVSKEVPGVEMRFGNPALKPHLGNFSLESMLPFGVVKREMLDRIETQFRALGAAK